RNYNLGSLVTFKWIARHYVNEIVMNPSLTYRFMRKDIREKFMIDISIGQCKRAKQCALYEHGEGLIEHYGRLWEYRQAVLETNPGSTCHLDVDFNNDGQPVFQRMYVCFKGVKDGWIAGCRKGRDGNNQMYPIAWAVVDVENKNKWCWFLSLLADDLDLQDGLGVTIISDSHKGLIEAVVLGAAASTIEQDFTRYMEHIRQLDPQAYRYLMEREPERWSKAYFQTGKSCASFENGISESFNAQIIDARGKPIISMLEDIRVYIMQRNWSMSKLAATLNDNITPSIRKHLEELKEKQRKWRVLPSGYQVVIPDLIQWVYNVGLHIAKV
ncbi:hypothetical protein Tco_1396797, partial [Tanacetum coccineum]